MSQTQTQAVDKKHEQKCFPVWHIDPSEIKDREKEPFCWGRGFGVVFRAKYKNRPVAFKLLRWRLGKNEMAEFRRETEIWRKLDHPHILPLLGYWDGCDNTTQADADADAKPFIVSPLMLNGTLKDYVFKMKRSDAEKLRIMSEVASGMAYLHENNIIHGDISSSNILLDGNLHAKISNFGLSHTKETSESSDYASHGHKVGGTLQYMAPEMLDWNNPSGSSNKTDVYAYGILLYEVMINGGAVWVDHDRKPLDERLIPLKVIRGDRPDRIRSDLQLGISNDKLWSLIQQCWYQCPTDRPSCQQLLSMIVDDSKESNQGSQKKQKRYHAWRIDQNSVKDRAEFPFGWGGFGLEFKATYDNRPVAFKLLLCRFGKMEMDEFRRDLDTWNQLEHPHILPLLGACDAFDTPKAKPFIVSPFMPNGTLKDYISKKKPSDADKIQIMSQVASGMAYLHNNNIIHGDISSLNVLLDEKFHAVISDFGFARTKHIASIDKEVSPDTLHYMAPEILDWNKLSWPCKETDLYAYGILFYEAMINGGAVWVTAEDGQRLINNKIKRYVVSGKRPERKRPDLQLEIANDNVWSLIQDCWRQAPRERPSFIQVFSRIGLTPVSGETSIEAREDSLPELWIDSVKAL